MLRFSEEEIINICISGIKAEEIKRKQIAFDYELLLQYIEAQEMSEKHELTNKLSIQLSYDIFFKYVKIKEYREWHEYINYNTEHLDYLWNKFIQESNKICDISLGDLQIHYKSLMDCLKWTNKGTTEYYGLEYAVRRIEFMMKIKAFAIC